MATYSTSLRLVLPSTGEFPGTWGDEVNNSLTALVDKAVAGSTSITMTAAHYTLTNANGVADEAKSMFLVLGGTPGGSYNVIVPTASKLYFVTNSTGAAQTVKTSAGSGISVPNGARMTLRCDGTNVLEAENYFASITLGSPLVATSGGTGQSSYAVGDLLFASTTTALSKLADVATGNALISGGVGVAPSYGKIGLTTHVSGTLPVANGGTNATATPTAGAVAYGTGTAYAFNTAGSSGQPLLSGGAGVPTFGTLGVAAGGTGATTLTANNVILGNGTSAVQFVAPGTNGNVLTSNGTTWTSAALAASLTGTTQSTSPFKTALGSGAGTSATGVGSTFVGYQAGLANTTGISNTALGYLAASSYTGSNSVAIGANAAYQHTGTNDFVAIGSNAFRDAVSGGISESVGIGYNAGAAITSGQWNVFVGRSAAAARTSGQDNVAVGYASNGASSSATGNSNVAVGSFALQLITSGANNTAVGYNTGSALTTGSNNTIIGYNAAASSATVSNEITLGNSSIATLRCQVTTITSLSDARDKKDVVPLAAGLQFTNALRPVSFNWNMRDGGKVDIPDTGFIAQDLKAVQEDTGITIPGLVYESNPDSLEASYGKLLPVLVKAIQELSAKVAQLEAQLRGE